MPKMHNSFQLHNEEEFLQRKGEELTSMSRTYITEKNCLCMFLPIKTWFNVGMLDRRLRRYAYAWDLKLSETHYCSNGEAYKSIERRVYLITWAFDC